MSLSNWIVALGAAGATLSLPTLAQTVKVTPLGGIDGEFCAQDRALVFEDPNGTRILYDPGHTVAGASDPRLGDVGLPTGYVLRFSNGLVTYLSGDTGITADQQVVVRSCYHAKLAVMNMGDGYTTGPEEAAYVINDLVKPVSVIPSHANEVGTVGGKVRPGSKTEAFIKAAKVLAHIALSGKTMEFDAAGDCTAGC